MSCICCKDNFTHILIYTRSTLEEQTTPSATGIKVKLLMVQDYTEGLMGVNRLITEFISITIGVIVIVWVDYPGPPCP